MAHSFLENVVDGGIDGSPLVEQEGEHALAFGGEPVKPLVAFVLFAPLACEEALGLEAAEEGVEGAFVDDQAAFGEGFAQGVAVVLVTQELGEDGDGEAAAAQLEAKILEERVVEGWGHAVPRTLCSTYCVIYSVWRQVFLSRSGEAGVIGRYVRSRWLS